jgi:PAS domain S-box-containing protein
MQKQIYQPISEKIFQREEVRFTVLVLLISTLVTFGMETLLMLLLEHLVNLPQPFDWVADGLLLVVCLFPLNYFFIVRPMALRIEKHRQTNLDLLKSNELLERFFSVSGVLIAYLDNNFNFIRVNEAYAASDNRLPDDFVGKNHFELFPNQENREIFETVVRTGEPYFANEKPFEYAGHPERGTSYWDWSLLPVKNPDSQVIALILVLTNVTDRKRAQLALVESERRFRAVFNQTFQHMGLLDPEGNTLLLNQTAFNFSGLSDVAVIGRPFWQLPWWVKPADTEGEPAEQLKAAIQRSALCEVVRQEFQVNSGMGEPVIMDITFKPLLDEHRNTNLIIYEARDITQRIRAEQALQESEEEICRLYQAEMNARQRAETLRSAVQALSGSLNTNTVLEVLLDHIYNVVPFSSAHILLLEDEEHLVVRLTRGEEIWDAKEHFLGKRFEINECLWFQQILGDAKTIFISDPLAWPSSEQFRTAANIQCWLGIPLRARDQIIGICLLGHRSPEFFTEEITQWTITLTNQATVAMNNAWLFEQVHDSQERLQALSRRLVETQEFERKYIARELHDDAGQALASLMFGLRILELDSGDQAAVIKHCHELKAITDDVLENLHRLVVNLRPASLDHLGLVPALRQHAETMCNQHGLAIQFETIGNIDRLPGEMETAIYRIVQEALTNIIRHAQATRVDVLLDRRDHHLIVMVEDNGIGFDPRTLKISQLGVLGMRERADMLGGKITIESAAGKGSTVVLEVPCPFAS